MVSTQVSVALGTIAVYMLVILALGYRGWQVGKLDIEDWMTAGRGLGIFVLLFTYAATYHSAFAFIGASGFMYSTGMGIYVPAYIWMVLDAVILWIIGSRIWLLGKKYNYITPSDLFEDFYDSKVLAKFVSLTLVVFTFPYIAIQMTGAGIIFETATNGLVPMEVGAAAFLVVGVVYVWLGGLRSVAWTDTFQGVFMVIAIWVAGFLILMNAFQGNPAAFWTELTANFSEHVTLPGPGGTFTGVWYVSWWIVLGLGIMMMPHIFLRYYAARSPRTLKWVSAGGTGYLMLFYMPLIFIALGGVMLLPDLGSPDSVVPTMLYEYTPVWFASIVVSGAVAAAMSTADSQLHAVATLITRDWYEDYALQGEIDNRKETRLAQILIPILGVIAYVIAIADVGLIVLVTNVAFEGAAQVFPLLLGALYWKRASTNGAIVGLVVGVVTTSVLKFGVITLPAAFPGFIEGFYGLMLNVVLFVGISLASEPVSDESIENIQGYIDYAANRRWTAEMASDDD